MGRANPPGFVMGSAGVWVRVDILLPSPNPYPSHGFHGLVWSLSSREVQPPIARHKSMDVLMNSFLVKNEAAGKKVLYDLGFMKAWKEKFPPLCESLLRAMFSIALWCDSN